VLLVCVGWICGVLKERACKAAQELGVYQNDVDEVVVIVKAFRRILAREVGVQSRWRVQALVK